MTDLLTLVPPADSIPACHHCLAPFTPRKGSGGKPQKYCSEECRRAADAQRDQRGPTRSDETKPGAVEPPQAEIVQRAVDQCRGAIQRQLEERAALAPPPDSPEFDWINSPDIVLREQPETAVYFNPNGALVIRQRADWNEENDPFVFICPNNIEAFIDKLCDLIGIPSAGK